MKYDVQVTRTRIETTIITVNVPDNATLGEVQKQALLDMKDGCFKHSICVGGLFPRHNWLARSPKYDADVVGPISLEEQERRLDYHESWMRARCDEKETE